MDLVGKAAVLTSSSGSNGEDDVGGKYIGVLVDNTRTEHARCLQL